MELQMANGKGQSAVWREIHFAICHLLFAIGDWPFQSRRCGAACHALALATLLTSPLGLIGAQSAEPSAARKPNIIFILADDLGYREVGCYGQKLIQTPNINRLAAEGMRFTQCYAGSSICSPSRSTLFTGLHTGHTPIRSNGGNAYLYNDDINVAKVLKQAGYTTGVFGKWDLGTEKTPSAPWRQGVDEFYGYLHQIHAHFYYTYWLWSNSTKVYLPENEGRKRVRYSHDEIQKQALQFIRRNRDRPFFCYLPYTLPHIELVVPEDSLKLYHGKWPEIRIPKSRPGYIEPTEPLATFAGMVSRLDRSVGEVVALLKELNLDTNTIIFFSGDNGPQGEKWKAIADFFHGAGPLRGYKRELYEGGIRVPMIVRWPGKVKEGSVCDHICAFWDFLPTAAEIAGIAAPSGLDGISFFPALLGGDQKAHDYLYWEMPAGAKRAVAVRVGDWKAVRPKPDAKLELYNLKDDPGETDDVADKNPDVLDRMKQIIARAHTPQRVYPAAGPQPTPGDYVR
jgi:arylsulfatase A